MNNGKKRAATKFNKKRTAGTITSASVYSALKKAGYGKPATKAYGTTSQRLIRREIKYDDDYMNLAEWVKSGTGVSTYNKGGGYVNYVLGGVVNTMMSSTSLIFGNGGTPAAGRLTLSRQVPNCLTNVDSGTTASTRIGNMIQPRYITIRGVLTAARTSIMDDAETTANQAALDVEAREAQVRFLRTSVKLYIIRDKSMNEKGFVEFSDVFAVPMQSSGELQQGSENPFLWNRKIDTISRYEIVKEVEYQLDQDDPQKSFTHVIALKGKPIRYNGASAKVMRGTNLPLWNGANETTIPGSQAPGILESTDTQSMTNGVYILAVSHSTVTGTNVDGFASPQIVMSSRLTFED